MEKSPSLTQHLCYDAGSQVNASLWCRQPGRHIRRLLFFMVFFSNRRSSQFGNDSSQDSHNNAHICFFRLAGGLSPRSLATFVVQNAERRVEISSLVSCASPVLFHGIGQDVPLLRGFAGWTSEAEYETLRWKNASFCQVNIWKSSPRSFALYSS